MFWKSRKKNSSHQESPPFEYPIGTIRVSEHPDGRWRCDHYGLIIPRSDDTVMGKPSTKAQPPRYIPAWTHLVVPPGNLGGFDTKELAIAAWNEYEKHKNDPDEIIFRTPPPPPPRTGDIIRKK